MMQLDGQIDHLSETQTFEEKELADLKDETARGEPHNDGDDDGQDEEHTTKEVAATSSLWRRLRKVLLIFSALWLTMAILRGMSKPRSKVIYASRYSEDFKFRPAASPIITEHLKDGRTRLRGAEPTARSDPPAKPKPKSKTRKRKSGRSKKARSGK